jgi:hypothetical protein
VTHAECSAALPSRPHNAETVTWPVS